jgi:thiamine biosynthesis lipoprotein
MTPLARCLALSLLFPLNGCAEETAGRKTLGHRLFTFKEPHMGTQFVIKIWAEQDSEEEVTRLSRRAFERAAELNQICSDYLPESEINDLARAPAGKPFPVSKDLYTVIDRARLVSERTDGAFDITAGPLIRLWRISKKNRALPSPEQIAKAKARTGSDLLELDPVARTVTKRVEGMLFDLGGIAKGYAADEVLDILREAGHPRSLVAASGDIVVGDPPPGRTGWTIALETLDLGIPVGDLPTVILANRAVSTSADTRQFLPLGGKRYSHIVSTRTGLGLTERIAASVIAPDATTSDSHATAVTLLGKEGGLRFIESLPGIECRIVELEGDGEAVTESAGFPR